MNPPRPQKKTGRQKNIGWSLNARLLHPQSKGALPKAQKMADKKYRFQARPENRANAEKRAPEKQFISPGRLNR